MMEKTELYKAIAAVMKDVKGIDKSMTVGEGRNAYKAVSDKDVKLTIGAAMQEHGLIMLPKSYDTKLQVERWEQTDSYGTKMKQSVFVEAKCVYELIHVESGQSVEIPGYGHGIDAQDKAAGKATTYAMKTALLYAFLVPTGAIDDTDKDHSDNKPVPQSKAPAKPAQKASIKDFPKVIAKMITDDLSIEAVRVKNTIDPKQLNIMRSLEAVKSMNLPRPEKQEAGKIMPVLEDICNILVHGMTAEQAEDVYTLDDKQKEFINKVVNSK